MKLSFCTTCMGRAHHLRQTLPRNLADSVDWSRPEAVEFVVLDYSSPDDLAEWITTDPRLRPYLEAGILKFARSKGQQPLPAQPREEHGARPRHRRLRLQRGRRQLRRRRFRGLPAPVFRRRPNVDRRHQPAGPRLNCSGRTRGVWAGSPCPRRTSTLLGGYDESARFRGWSGEDTDLLIRAFRMVIRWCCSATGVPAGRAAQRPGADPADRVPRRRRRAGQDRLLDGYGAAPDPASTSSVGPSRRGSPTGAERSAPARSPGAAVDRRGPSAHA